MICTTDANMQASRDVKTSCCFIWTNVQELPSLHNQYNKIRWSLMVKNTEVMMQQGSFQMQLLIYISSSIFFNIVICFIEEKNNTINMHHCSYWEDKTNKRIFLFHFHFILPLTRNTTTVYRNTLKIIYNIPTKLFTRLNVVKARKPI